MVDVDDTRVRLDVELRLDGETIRGTVDDDAGAVLEFTGWLELMSAFETVRLRAAGGAREPRDGR